MNDHRHPFHHRSQVDVDATAESLFAHLDDHRRLVSHMEKPSLMMAGATMRVETDELQGQAVGSVIRVSGRVLGMVLSVEEVVTERIAPWSKTWETRGEPRLLVIGAYRMGFTITPRERASRLVVSIDYELPQRGLGRVLGRLFGSAYAAWCTRRMTEDAAPVIAGMTPVVDRRLATWTFVVCGLWLLALGFYFMFMRPPLLPEDLRYVGTTLAQVQATLPGLERWLGRVFTVLGGFMAGAGVLTVFVALSTTVTRPRGTSRALALSGLLTVGLMSATNFALDSAFKWLLLVPALLWLAGLVLLQAAKRKEASAVGKNR